MRLILLAHAATAATRDVRFGSGDAPVEPAGARAARRMAHGLRRVDLVLSSPAAACRETALLLGREPRVEPALGDLAFGRWRGRRFEDVAAGEPAALNAWLDDPAAAPHEGESRLALGHRVAALLAGLASAPERQRCLAVTHAAVIRAAVMAVLGASPAAFWRIDVAPLSRTVLQGGPGRPWTLQGVNRPWTDAADPP